MSFLLEQVASRAAASVLSLKTDEGICMKLDAVQCIFSDIRIGVAKKINRDRPDLLALLPTEIHSMCFDMLDLRDRIAASQVCSRWRAVALAYPGLWKYVNLGEFSVMTRHDEELELFRQRSALETCLARAGTLPVYVVGQFMSYELSEVVWSQIDKISHVVGTLHSPQDDWLGFSAPHLAHLDCDAVDLPDQFGGHLVPRLHTLLTSTLKIPDIFSPVYTLERLSCCVVPSGPLTRVFELFPNLRELHLSNFIPDPVLPSQLPQSLQDLWLINVNVDLSRYMSLWSAAHSLRELHIGCHKNEAAIVKFFLESVGGDEPFSIEIATALRDRQRLVTLIPSREDLCKVFLSCTCVDIGHPAMQKLYDRATSLVLPCCQTTFFFRALSRMFFPTLTDLVVRNESARENSLPFDGMKLDRPTVRAPALRRMTFRCLRSPKLATSGAGDYPELGNLRRLAEFSASLERLTIESPDINLFKACDMTQVFAFTDEVVCRGVDDCTLFWRVARCE